MVILHKILQYVSGSRFLRALLFLFLAASLCAFALFFGLRALNHNGPHEAPVLVTDGYHLGCLWLIAVHPFPFLLSISLVLALAGALWITKLRPKTQPGLVLGAFLVPWIALLITSPLWGLIWSLYTWPPASFSNPAVMWMFYQNDTIFGLTGGWLSALVSFPIDLLSYAAAVVLLLVGKRLDAHG